MIEVELKGLFGRLGRTCSRSIEAAAGVCVARGQYEVTVEHVFASMLDEAGSDLAEILTEFEVDTARLRQALNRELERLRIGNSGRPVFAPLLIEWLQHSWLLASIDLGLEQVRSGAMVAALLQGLRRLCAGDWADLLADIPRDELKKRFASIVARSNEQTTAPARPTAPGAPAGQDALARFAIDFTERARKGEVDPVYGRDREIRQMIDILARRRKNNPIAVGEAGVGKTAVVEGLALRIVEGDVPQALAGVRVLSLDVGLLQAGAGVKGEFENRIKSVLEEVKASAQPIVLFIDEAHTLIGSGGAAGAGDAANLLKPALARGELRTIAATTWSEYKKYFEKDAALARRFQLVKLDEPSDADAITMLRGLRDRYEKAHGVPIRDDALVAAARLGSRYISGRQHPDKGVDLMDTAAARVKIALTTKPPALQDLERRIETLEREQAAHVRDAAGGTTGKEPRLEELATEIAATRSEQKTLTERWQHEQRLLEPLLAARRELAAAPDHPGHRKALQKALDELRRAQGREPLLQTEVDGDVIARVIADWTGIPLGKMVQDEAESLLAFEDNLKQRIKGQDHALAAVGRGIRAAKAGLKDPRQPIGNFLFVGPSGVGKTECALGVADLLFGGERFMTVINMSEFQEKHTVSRLIGSPPGYVGYGEGGVLTEAVRQRPYSVVLLDEVEKADPEVMNLFYQVFDKGSLADGEGREVDFKDTAIFMTSNLATDAIMQACARGKPDVDELVATIRPILSRHFKPALLARMTIVPFHPIDPAILAEIVVLKLERVGARLKESHRMALEYDPKVVQAIAERCTEVETGARNVDHIIAGSLLPRISTEILQQMAKGPLPERLRIGVGAKSEFTYEFQSATRGS